MSYIRSNIPGTDAINEVKRTQQSETDANFLIKVSDATYQNIMNVFPELEEVELNKANILLKEPYEPRPEQSISKYVSRKQQIKYEDFFRKTSESKFVGLIGLKGTGKTFLCNRIAQDFNAICIFVSFMNLNYNPTHKLTLRQLLLDNNYPNLKRETYESAFKWILENEDKCLIILDGYDQANWSLVENPPVVTIDELQCSQHLVSNLCNGNYLSGCHILLTSRPHKMATIPSNIRADLIVRVLELSDADAKALFYEFAGEKSEELWKKLHFEAPQIAKLCSTPLLLQLIAKECLYPTFTTNNFSTMARLFDSIIIHLGMSDLDTKNKFANLAFKMTYSETIEMTKEHLTKYGLTSNILQNLVTAGYNQPSDSYKIIQGDETMVFLHPTIQEFLAAFYILNIMPPDTFLWFLQQKLFTPNWAVVRLFVYGMAFDLQKDDESKEFKENKLLLRKTLRNLFGLIPVANPGDVIIALCCVVRECADEQITEQAAESLPARTRIGFTRPHVSEIYAVAIVLKKRITPMEWLNLSDCNCDSDGFYFIAEAIKAMQSEIDELEISYNWLKSEDVNVICDILHKVKECVAMKWCFKSDGSPPWRHAEEYELRKIQEKLNRLGDSSLVVYIDSEDNFLQRNRS